MGIVRHETRHWQGGRDGMVYVFDIPAFLSTDRISDLLFSGQAGLKHKVSFPSTSQPATFLHFIGGSNVRFYCAGIASLWHLFNTLTC